MKHYKNLLSNLDLLNKKIAVAREEEANLIARRVVAILREEGIDICAILNVSNSNKRPLLLKAKPKYWNPSTGATWSGRGRPPSWLKNKNLEDYIIQSIDSKE